VPPAFFSLDSLYVTLTNSAGNAKSGQARAPGL
jgi:hypothetical protein